MTTEIICIRHGQTPWNQQLRYQGKQDINLDEVGYRQVKEIGNYLSQRDIDLIYSSDLTRARETAENIVSYHGLKIEYRVNLREIDFGEWEGLTFREISNQYPEITEKWIEDPLQITPPGAETLVNFQKRIVKAFSEIIKEGDGSKIVVVTHGGCIKVWLAHFLGMSLKDYWKLNVDLGSISVVKVFAGQPVLSLLNYTDHILD